MGKLKPMLRCEEDDANERGGRVGTSARSRGAFLVLSRTLADPFAALSLAFPPSLVATLPQWHRHRHKPRLSLEIAGLYVLL